jgi:nucleoid-associated protein YgaU
MDLFFDSYEMGFDVRYYTDQIAFLATIETHGNMHRPPICRLSWGPMGMLFQGALQSLTQRFTLFLADGTPVRAVLNCTFKEWRSNEEESKRLNLQSADVAKTYTLRRGDRLSGVAAREYNNARLWRPIAEANRIDNPRDLTPGMILVIPPLRDEGALEVSGGNA